MAVYTEVGFDEADRLLRTLGLGALTDSYLAPQSLEPGAVAVRTLTAEEAAQTDAALVPDPQGLIDALIDELALLTELAATPA